MTHHLVPISQLPTVPLPRERWRCVRCGKRWDEIGVDEIYEECPGGQAA
jgi:hypothetical protein